MGWQFRIPLYPQADHEASRQVVEVHHFFTHLLARHLTAIPGPLVALENSFVVEVFKITQSRIFDQPPAKY